MKERKARILIIWVLQTNWLQKHIGYGQRKGEELKSDFLMSWVKKFEEETKVYV